MKNKSKRGHVVEGAKELAKKPLDQMLQALAAEARDLERLRIAAWLMAEAIRHAEGGDVATSSVIEKLARRVRVGAIELGAGGDT